MLPSGEVLAADIVIAGVGKQNAPHDLYMYIIIITGIIIIKLLSIIYYVGVVPATDFLKSHTLPLSSRGEVIVDEVRMTSLRQQQLYKRHTLSHTAQLYFVNVLPYSRDCRHTY